MLALKYPIRLLDVATAKHINRTCQVSVSNPYLPGCIVASLRLFCVREFYRGLDRVRPVVVAFQKERVGE
jgi:hypothetical protein